MPPKSRRSLADKLTDADCLISKDDWELLADMRKYAEPAWATVGVNKNPEGASVTSPTASEPYVEVKRQVRVTRP